MSQGRRDPQVIGAAGEFLTAGKLFKLGLQVGVTYGNAKAIDLFVMNPRTGRKWAVQVKTQYKKNCFPARLERMSRADIFVFVRLNAPSEREEFFVVPGSAILDAPRRFFGGSLDKAGGVPAINYGPLLEYRDKWGVFDE